LWIESAHSIASDDGGRDKMGRTGTRRNRFSRIGQSGSDFQAFRLDAEGRALDASIGVEKRCDAIRRACGSVSGDVDSLNRPPRGFVCRNGHDREERTWIGRLPRPRTADIMGFLQNSRSGDV
jgi:hypothetical protein